MAAICLVVTGASVGPMAITLREAAHSSLRHIVELKVMAIEEFLSRGATLAQQVTSRTVIRDKLADYHDGKVDLAAVADFTRDKLVDSLNLSAELVGIVRLNAKGELVVAVGKPFDWAGTSMPGLSATQPTMSPPTLIDGQPYIVMAAPINSRIGQRLGVDLVLIDARRLLGILRDGHSLGETGDIAIVTSETRPRLLIPFGHEPARDGGVLAPEGPIARIVAATITGHSPLVEAKGDPILVAAAIPGTDWVMVMRMGAAEATASVDRLVIAVIATAAVLALFGVIGLMAVLRPLTGSIIIHTNDMRRQIEDLERARAELQEKTHQLALSNADLQEYAYVASHDLQEPLRMISSYAQLLERRYKGKLDEEATEFIGYMVDGVKRMQAIILHLLDYSRVGGKGQSYSAFDSGDAVASALANLAGAIKASGGEVTTGSLPVVWADRMQFTRLMQNLIGNAIKYHLPEQAPHVAITAEREDRYWRFCVSDNGIGIDPQYFERIFKLFQRLHPRGEFEGTGIGLAICRKIVEIHGGSMWVDSEPGHGAKFFFTLPDVTVSMAEGQALAQTESV
ncbi:sensor histidine kinase [Paramagnetospirillum kuznetsovii]|nr:sensor histidine kinase [Paramagnetospirillum kuznetsovii]